MELEIFAVGGYNEVGRNMTCVRYGREAVIFDMGIHLDRLQIHEDAVFEELSPDDLIKMHAIPDDDVLKHKGLQVKAIVLGHGHLDHIGAVVKLASKYKAPIFGSPYTCAILEQGLEDKRHGARIPNKVIPLRPGQERNLSKDLTIELVHVTHSIAQACLGVLHTPKGAVVYALDYKFDNTPVIGNKPDYDRIRSLGDEGVKALIVESIRADEETKTPSEAIARDMLKDYLFGLGNDRHGLIVSTFSSHTARIKSIVEFGQQMGRRVMLVGRSVEKYTAIAQEHGLLKLPKGVELVGGGREAENAMKHVTKEGKEEFLVVATGHQGEPGSLLSKIADGKTAYRVEKNDHVIFSADVIPNPTNRANRYVLETKLKGQGARLIKGAHVSGHASREDHRELLAMLEPENIFPAHGNLDMQSNFAELAENHGWKLNDSVFLSRNGASRVLKV
ncbi:MAG TPA: RNase J family beta-CASP ribonuclease [Candidatus Thermoplasmatota archaeon]|nr:RNase J family beta-CASP ribonuclease [Candidatus Thermoplasmatota archaeon]